MKFGLEIAEYILLGLPRKDITMTKRKMIFFFGSFLITLSLLFFHPLTHLLGYIGDSRSIHLNSTHVTVPEHVLLLVAGIALIGAGVFSRRMLHKQKTDQ